MLISRTHSHNGFVTQFSGEETIFAFLKVSLANNENYTNASSRTCNCAFTQ